MKRLIIFATIVASLGLASFAAAANTTSNSLSYEFDNGTSWTLQQNSASLTSTYTSPTYSDSGIVVDIGPLSSLTGNTGLTVTGSGVQDNIWISTGTSEANTPGTHTLGSALDFAYGFDNHDGTFYMASDPGGSYAGQNATFAELQAEYPNAEAYAWVGVVYSGATVSGSVSSVDGHSVGNRAMSFTNNPDGTATAVIR